MSDMSGTRILFGTCVALYGDPAETTDVIVEADILPGDVGSLHYPPSDPIPEIVSVVVDPDGPFAEEFDAGEDVTDLIDEEQIQVLEDAALREYIEGGREDEDDPENDDTRDDELDDDRPLGLEEEPE